MPNALNTREILRQNLLDAGCSPEFVWRCLELAQERKHAELMRNLTGHRRALLELVHQNEKRIDCLDYLIYRIKKQRNELTGGNSHAGNLESGTGMG